RLEDSRLQISKGEKRLVELQDQCQKAKNEVQKRNAQYHALANDIQQAEQRKAHWVNEIGKLESTYENELHHLREKVDAEYARQILAHEDHFRELRERENLALLDLLKRFEAHEENLLPARAAQIHERLWHLIADRSALYGMNKIKESVDFREDLQATIQQCLTEEFEFRRRELPTLTRSPESLHRRQNRKRVVVRYAGWALSVGLLAILAYGQIVSSLSPKPERMPASCETGVNEAFHPPAAPTRMAPIENQ
ncbi:MAG: hypothetical protein NDI61_14335, partial [Bdellovibrionaceae bacterium]|nr:hypothetical protein [Pseudobdellovibrionaceae bacterium]